MFEALSESIGKAGLEIQYDSYLRGTPGIKTVIVDRKEAITRTSQNTKPIPGNHLVTSIDIRLQASAEKALADAVRRAKAAGRYAAEGDVVLLAPAAASMDQFKDYADRGNSFALAVRSTIGGDRG